MNKIEYKQVSLATDLAIVLATDLSTNTILFELKNAPICDRISGRKFSYEIGLQCFKVT